LQGALLNTSLHSHANFSSDFRVGSPNALPQMNNKPFTMSAIPGKRQLISPQSPNGEMVIRGTLAGITGNIKAPEIPQGNSKGRQVITFRTEGDEQNPATKVYGYLRGYTKKNNNSEFNNETKQEIRAHGVTLQKPKESGMSQSKANILGLHDTNISAYKPLRMKPQIPQIKKKDMSLFKNNSNSRSGS